MPLFLLELHRHDLRVISCCTVGLAGRLELWELGPGSLGVAESSPIDGRASVYSLPSGEHPVFDVFLSYAREDRERARTVASALEAVGWSVWWDRKIVAGESFDRTIEEQLKSACAVVVLWSIHSIDSEWVRNEAADASEREALVPALIGDVKQPLEFRRRHAANLTEWSGDPADPSSWGCIRG